MQIDFEHSFKLIIAHAYILYIHSVNADLSIRSKRWCSTRVDSNGVHVSGVGEFGHCGSGCPAQCAPKADPACRPIAHCSSRISPNDIASKSCKQANGALGLCCGDVLKNNGRYILMYWTCIEPIVPWELSKKPLTTVVHILSQECSEGLH